MNDIGEVGLVALDNRLTCFQVTSNISFPLLHLETKMVYSLPDQFMQIYLGQFKLKILLINLGHLQHFFHLLKHSFIFLPDNANETD